MAQARHFYIIHTRISQQKWLYSYVKNVLACARVDKWALCVVLFVKVNLEPFESWEILLTESSEAECVAAHTHESVEIELKFK